jgi:two-component system alkaline phosphatase synthesis response regulator PhoP
LDVGNTKVVVIEDEPDILEVIQHNLSREGFKVVPCSDGAEGLKAVQNEAPAIVLLDLMLPGMDGLEICRSLKMDTVTQHIPIVMITAKAEESDIVLGLGLGADDYITKPFRPRELVARVKAVLRRVPPGASAGPERLVRSGLTVDAVRHQVMVDDSEVKLTATEFRLLHFIASHPGRVFTRDQLVHRAIGEDAVVVDRNIDVHVRSIRQKLGRYRAMIETVRGVGYRFREVDEDPLSTPLD